MNQAIRFVVIVFVTLVPCSHSFAQEPCGEWIQVAPPAGTTAIKAVTANSSTDAWAINDDLNFDGIIHWNGTTWSNMQLPDLSSYGYSTVLHSTASLAPGHFFVAGVITTSVWTTEQVLLTWDGSGWDQIGTVELVPDIAGAPRHGTPYSIAGVAPDDLWLIGSAWDMGTGTGTGLVLTVHWDGSQLTEHMTPGVGDRQNHLYDADAVAADDIWAVGKYNNTGLDDYTFHGMVYHYDGNSWSHAPSPTNNIDSSHLYAVAAIASDDVWAAGDDLNGPLFMHWDGNSWTIAPGPPGATGSIRRLAAIATDDVWAVDWSYPIGDYYHWDGIAWSTVTPEIPGATSINRHGGLTAVGDCDVWAVGSVDFGQGIEPFTERLQSEDIIASVTPAGGFPRLASITRITPNPFNPRVEITFTLGRSGPALLAIHDLRGFLVRTLHQGTMDAGRYTLVWNGADAQGTTMASGTYIVSLHGPGHSDTRKVVLIQ